MQEILVLVDLLSQLIEIASCCIRSILADEFHDVRVEVGEVQAHRFIQADL